MHDNEAEKMMEQAVLAVLGCGVMIVVAFAALVVGGLKWAGWL